MSWVLFFDGECAFCSSSVRWAARFDKHQRLSFAPLQGKLAADKGLSKYAAENGGTMVLLREADDQVFTRSSALIELSRVLGGCWRLCSVSRFIPRAWRDRAYDWVANHRYLFMGKSATCSLPDPAFSKRLRE